MPTLSCIFSAAPSAPPGDGRRASHVTVRAPCRKIGQLGRHAACFDLHLAGGGLLGRLRNLGPGQRRRDEQLRNHALGGRHRQLKSAAEADHVMRSLQQVRVLRLGAGHGDDQRAACAQPLGAGGDIGRIT